MEHQPDQPDYHEKILQLNQGVLFCFNEDGEKMPVGVINNFVFEDAQNLHFNSDFFPLMQEAQNIFAAELHCYKKGIPFSLVLHGVASVKDENNYLIRFSIMQADYFELHSVKTNNGFEPFALLLKPYKYVYQKGSEIFSHTFKKKSGTEILH